VWSLPSCFQASFSISANLKTGLNLNPKNLEVDINHAQRQDLSSLPVNNVDVLLPVPSTDEKVTDLKVKTQVPSTDEIVSNCLHTVSNVFDFSSQSPSTDKTLINGENVLPVNDSLSRVPLMDEIVSDDLNEHLIENTPITENAVELLLSTVEGVDSAISRDPSPPRTTHGYIPAPAPMTEWRNGV
jgi:hypothetical protein